LFDCRLAFASSFFVSQGGQVFVADYYAKKEAFWEWVFYKNRIGSGS